MNWRIGDHRRFQWDALAIAGAGGGIGVVAWAWQLGDTAWWMATGVGPLMTLLAGARRAEAAPPPQPIAGGVEPFEGSTSRVRAHLPPRRSLVLVAVAAITGAALAGGTWEAFASPVETLALVEAALVGLLAGLAASLGLALVHVERVPAAPLAVALADARAALTGDELALAERAAAAHQRIAGDLGSDSGATPDARRLGRLSEDVTLQVLGLALRCRGLRRELARLDLDAVRRRGAALVAAAAETSDEATRADLTRAARAVVALDERAQALAGAAARVRARLELQVAMLEATALAVATRQASAAVDHADALAPLADRLHEAGCDLHDQAQALAEASASALVH